MLAIIPELANGHGTAALFTSASTEDTNDSSAPLGQWRTLRSTFAYLMAADQLRSVTVTSLYPGEGKTTVAVNLAASLAELGLSVVLVDAAIRDPSLHKIFGVGNDRGLTSTVTDQADPASLLHSVPSIAGLQVVTAGDPLPAPIGENSPYLKRGPRSARWPTSSSWMGCPTRGHRGRAGCRRERRSDSGDPGPERPAGAR